MATQAKLFRDPNGVPAQLFTPSGTRAQVSTSGTGTTAATALPSGFGTTATVVEIRTTGTCYINFGASDVAASAAATSQLFPAGEKLQILPSTATHFAVIRVGADDVTVQIELMSNA